MSRINRERKTIRYMIDIYCSQHHNKKELCSQCLELWQYASSRLDKCTFGEQKPVCVKCPIHCYKPDMREKVRAVMKYQAHVCCGIIRIWLVCIYLLTVKEKLYHDIQKDTI